MFDLCSEKKDLRSGLNSVSQVIQHTVHMHNKDVSLIPSVLLTLTPLCFCYDMSLYLFEILHILFACVCVLCMLFFFSVFVIVC